MLDTKTKFILIVFILVGSWLMHTQVTSADLFAERRVGSNGLKAATLSFGLRTPFNADKLTNLFTVIGMQPDGFEIRAARLVKDGKIDIAYTVTVEKVAGDENLCNALTLTVLQNNKEIYKGPTLQFHLDSLLKDSMKDTFVYLVSLDKSDDNLKNKTCEFKFIYNSSSTQGSSTLGGLRAKSELQSVITSGTW